MTNTNPVLTTTTTNVSTGSRKTCGRRLRRKCNYLGERRKPCIGRSAKSRWLNVPTSLSSTSHINQALRIRLVLGRRVDQAHLLLAWHHRLVSHTRTRTTTACLRYRTLTPIHTPQSSHDYDETATIRYLVGLHYDEEPTAHALFPARQHHLAEDNYHRSSTSLAQHLQLLDTHYRP